MLSIAGLNLATQQRLIADGTAKKNNKSVILIWLDGGPSQLESYDPKPEAPSEFRGPFGTIKVEAPTCFKAPAGLDQSRANDRSSLLASLDLLRRDVDKTGVMDVMDAHHQSAMSLVFGGAAIDAFDISNESPEVAERYGKNPWGQYTLMARRLVEAGVTFVTVDMPHWDHPSQLVEGHAPNMRAMDQCVGALMTDLVDRGLLDQVMVIVMGEFGRTRRINEGQAGIPLLKRQEG